MERDFEATEVHIFRLMGALRRRMARDLARYGLTFPQFMALQSLEKAEGPCRMGPLAALALQSLPAMTGIVDRLEEKGLVERRRDPEDRRSVIVVLTERGKDVLSRIRADRRRTLEEIFKKLTPEEIKALNAIMEKIIHALEAAEPDIPATE